PRPLELTVDAPVVGAGAMPVTAVLAVWPAPRGDLVLLDQLGRERTRLVARQHPVVDAGAGVVHRHPHVALHDRRRRRAGAPAKGRVGAELVEWHDELIDAGVLALVAEVPNARVAKPVVC